MTHLAKSSEVRGTFSERDEEWLKLFLYFIRNLGLSLVRKKVALHIYCMKGIFGELKWALFLFLSPSFFFLFLLHVNEINVKAYDNLSFAWLSARSSYFADIFTNICFRKLQMQNENYCAQFLGVKRTVTLLKKTKCGLGVKRAIREFLRCFKKCFLMKRFQHLISRVSWKWENMLVPVF